MYVHTYIYMDIVYLYTYTHIYVYIYVYLCTYTHIYIYIYIYLYIYMYVHTYIYMDIVYLYTYTHIYIYLYIYIYICMCVYIYICIQSKAPPHRADESPPPACSRSTPATRAAGNEGRWRSLGLQICAGHIRPTTLMRLQPTAARLVLSLAQTTATSRPKHTRISQTSS